MSLIDPVYSIKAAAHQLAVSPTTIRRLIARGDLQSCPVGCQHRIRRSSIDAYLNREHPEPVRRGRPPLLISIGDGVVDMSPWHCRGHRDH